MDRIFQSHHHQETLEDIRLRCESENISNHHDVDFNISKNDKPQLFN